jgi:hypothetical protein
MSFVKPRRKYLILYDKEMQEKMPIQTTPHHQPHHLKKEELANISVFPLMK